MTKKLSKWDENNVEILEKPQRIAILEVEKGRKLAKRELKKKMNASKFNRTGKKGRY